MTTRLSNPIKEVENKILCKYVKEMDMEKQERVLNNYATCLDCRIRFFDERGVNPSGHCRLCDYQNYKLF